MTVIAYIPPRHKNRWENPRREAFLRANSFLDTAILAEEIGLSFYTTSTYLRILKLRRCTNNRE